MTERDMLFGSITSSPALNFSLHIGITVSELLVLYEPAELKEKRTKKGDNWKSFDQSNQPKITTAQTLSSWILSSQTLRYRILSSSKPYIQFRRSERTCIR